MFTLSRWRRKTAPKRCFARLDAQGRCLSLWSLHYRPEGDHWREVSELNPLWIGRTLPNHALVTHSASRARPTLERGLSLSRLMP